MSSDSSTLRREPQLERGERRVVQVLETAAVVLAELGYEAATMTEVAKRAGASIGTIYQYFPNKEALVQALRNQYAAEMVHRWEQVEEATKAMSVEQMAHHIVELTACFVNEHPAYYAVVDAPVKYQRSPQARQRLREGIAKVFRNRKRGLSPETAFRMANVALQIVKSMHALYADANPQERQALVKEYKRAVAAYLESRLGS
ncbi:MAG TPA: TetR/AcrR family transcriptional regulator [Acidobacteriaceae bacterium]